MLVDEAMITKVQTVPPDASLASLLVVYYKEEISRLVYVVDKSQGLIGIISSFDVLNKLVSGDFMDKLLGRRSEFMIEECIKRHAHITAADLMLTKYVSVGPYENILKAMDIISQKRILALPVVSDNRLRGEVSRHTILRAVALASRSPHVRQSQENKRPQSK